MNPPRIIYPTDEDYAPICRIDTGSNSFMVYIRPGTDEEIATLTKGDSIKIIRDDVEVIIDETNCYSFGSIDLNNEDDINFIKSFKWCGNRIAGYAIPKNYDFVTNTGDSYKSIADGVFCPATVETFDNIKLFKFAYAKIGKPKNVIIYAINVKSRKRVNYGNEII